MSAAQQALALARVDAGGPSDGKVLLAAWDRLHKQLSTLDSKTSVLLRFNAIVVAALAYVAVMRGIDPFAGAGPVVTMIGTWVGHVSLVIAVASCGFAFPVINVESDLATGAIDEAALDRLGALVMRRTWLYSWAWRLAVAGGAGFALLVGIATFH